MTKKQLLELMQQESGLTKTQTMQAYEAALESISDALATGESVHIHDFGAFSISERGARKGKNPRTGAPIDIPASRSVKFKPAKLLRDTINAAEDPHADNIDDWLALRILARELGGSLEELGEKIGDYTTRVQSKVVEGVADFNPDPRALDKAFDVAAQNFRTWKKAIFATKGAKAPKSPVDVKDETSDFEESVAELKGAFSEVLETGEKAYEEGKKNLEESFGEFKDALKQAFEKK